MKCQGTAIWYDLKSMPKLYFATACSLHSVAMNCVLPGGKLREEKQGGRLWQDLNAQVIEDDARLMILMSNHSPEDFQADLERNPTI